LGIATAAGCMTIHLTPPEPLARPGRQALARAPFTGSSIRRNPDVRTAGGPIRAPIHAVSGPSEDRLGVTIGRLVRWRVAHADPPTTDQGYLLPKTRRLLAAAFMWEARNSLSSAISRHKGLGVPARSTAYGAARRRLRAQPQALPGGRGSRRRAFVSNDGRA
jgi:hypothetical protein